MVREAVAEELAEGQGEVGPKELSSMSKVRPPPNLIILSHKKWLLSFSHSSWIIFELLWLFIFCIACHYYWALVRVIGFLFVFKIVL